MFWNLTEKVLETSFPFSSNYSLLECTINSNQILVWRHSILKHFRTFFLLFSLAFIPHRHTIIKRFLVVQWLRLCTSTAGAQVRSSLLPKK